MINQPPVTSPVTPQAPPVSPAGGVRLNSINCTPEWKQVHSEMVSTTGVSPITPLPPALEPLPGTPVAPVAPMVPTSPPFPTPVTPLLRATAVGGVAWDIPNTPKRAATPHPGHPDAPGYSSGPESPLVRTKTRRFGW